jgi:23S rRNA pseudouridine2457 synthase
MATLILLNKPYQVLSQFTDSQNRTTLASYLDAPGFYPAGRLDYDSEGLILLCDDGALQQRITDPRHKLWKSYLLQLEGLISDTAISALTRGIALKDGMTLPARVARISQPALWARDPPIRQRASQPTSWIRIAIREGRNRQLRRMCAAVDFPVLRLVRRAIGDWELGNLAPGEYRREIVHLPRASGKTPRPGSTDNGTGPRGHKGPRRR